jgi:hypothetical protein
LSIVPARCGRASVAWIVVRRSDFTFVTGDPCDSAHRRQWSNILENAARHYQSDDSPGRSM